MSESHKEILRKGNAAITAGDHEGFLAFCTDDTTWTFVGEQTLKGKEAVRRYMKDTYIEPPDFTIDHLIAESDFLAATGKITIKDKNGKAIHYSYCDVWRFRDGKLAELKAFVIKSGEEKNKEYAQ